VIKGKYVTLRTAKLEQQKLVYEMALSTGYMRGRFQQDYPGGFVAFAEDYNDVFFDNKTPSVCGAVMIYVGDEPAGFISYSSESYGKAYLNQGILEIDVWTNGENNCGKGLGSDAVATLTDHLNHEYGIHTFIILPETGNLRAVRAYEKAGFGKIGGNEKQSMLKAVYRPEYLANYIDELDYLNNDGTFNDGYVFMVKDYR